MSGKKKSKLSFNTVVWVGAAAAILWLLGMPLIKNEWARRTWKVEPCKTTSLGYEYQVNGTKYVATRQNFWAVITHAGRANHQVMELPDAECWVNPSDPLDAVLRLDTATNWAGSTGRLASATMVVIVAGVFTLFGKKPAKAGAGAAP